MHSQDDIIVGLDIGTTKICCVVGEVSGDEINIIGIGTHPSIGPAKRGCGQHRIHGGVHQKSRGRGRTHGRVRNFVRLRGNRRRPHHRVQQPGG